MAVNYNIQGTRYASRGRGYRCLRLRVEIAYIEEVARILMYARHRRNRTLLQFDACQGIAEDDLGSTYKAFMILNVDERMRLSFSTRDPGCDLETIRFNFEELAFPWLTEQPAHTICTSRNFCSEYGFPEKFGLCDCRTKYVLTRCYKDRSNSRFSSELAI